MTKRMLLDASHPDETRVIVLDGSRLDEFDYETKDKKQLKGNIYLAKVTRVEPSLQAAFVDYGGNRHGFLPFSEIHPDYYRLPIADREALLAEEEQLKTEAGDEEAEAGEAGAEPGEEAAPPAAEEAEAAAAEAGDGGAGEDSEVEQLETATSVETLDGDEIEDAARRRAQLLRRYKIQEVIKRRQVILVQVVKEERGTKGAALTTYLSLAGRYCVLMPNTGKGGGISRKISNPGDRRRLKQILVDLSIPEGMAVIVRTAGAQRNKTEIKRDYEYLLRLWDEVRATTLESTAPCLIYEEANLIKRAIRDLYTRDMDEILVEGEDGYKAAKRFMRNLMPSHARKVQLYKDSAVPLFHRYDVEEQLDNIHNPSVQLKSGGYIVINQTEALVAIDVNSGRATKERHIEETALKTNLEAADEAARQLKLRDLAGLIVIDFIDMDANRNNREVEHRLKDAMRHDRARIQLGRISPFGLLELSRQRLRPSLHETSTEVCRTCGGSGFVRSPDSTALHVLRGLEEEGIKRGGGELQITVPGQIALYLVNQKRERLVEIEQRYGFRVVVDIDDRLVPPSYRLDRLSTAPQPAAAEAEAEAPTEDERAGEGDRRRGRRRRGRSRREDEGATAEAAGEAAAGEAEERQGAEGDSQGRRRRRRGKRGGRRRARRREGAQEAPAAEAADETPPAEPAEAESAAAGEGEPAPAESPAADEVRAAEAGPADEAKPKRRRPSRRKAASGRGKTRTKAAAGADGDEPATAAEAAGGDGQAAAEPGTAEQGTAEKTAAGAKRRRPSRRKTAKGKSAESSAGAESPETVPAESGGRDDASEAARDTGRAEPAADGDSAAAFGEVAEPDGEPVPAGEGGRGSEADEAEQPRRRGWWSRMLN